MSAGVFGGVFGGTFAGVVSGLLGESTTDLRGLLLPRFQSELIKPQRAALIISRVRLIAAAFAVLTPTWIVLDVLFFPGDVWTRLAVARLVASVGFGVLALAFRRSDRIADAYVSMALLFAIPTAFFVFSHWLFQGDAPDMTGLAASLVAGYAFLPFVMAAGLSVFPLTAVEGIAFALPAIGVQFLTGTFGDSLLGDGAQVGLLWLITLIAGVAVLSGMSQLHYLGEIIVKSAHDALTGAFTRSSGEELLEKYYLLAKRNDTPLTLVFVDIDNFKSVNDTFGHEAGDRVLREVARRLQTAIRRVDLLIRWGGEEFVIAAPFATRDDATALVGRLCDSGLGRLPDGRSITASLGQADFPVDGRDGLLAFVETADKRMYRAKTSGKNRLCFGDGAGDVTPVGVFR